MTSPSPVAPLAELLAEIWTAGKEYAGRSSVRDAHVLRKRDKAIASIESFVTALIEENKRLREDADRWRAVLPTLTVRNTGIASFAEEGDLTPAFTWRKTWLESKRPLEGVALNPTEYADALRSLGTLE